MKKVEPKAIYMLNKMKERLDSDLEAVDSPDTDDDVVKNIRNRVNKSRKSKPSKFMPTANPPTFSNLE